MKHFLAVIAMAMTMHSIGQTKDTPPLAIDDLRMDSYLQNRKPAVLRIRVINSKTALDKIAVKYTIVHVGPEFQVPTTTTLNALGELSITLNENLPYQQVWLYIENYVNTVLVVNEDLTLTINAGQKEISFWSKELKLEGADGLLNEQLLKHICFNKSQRSALTRELTDVCMAAAMNQLPVHDMQTKADLIYTEMKKRDAAFLAQSPGFAWAIESETKAEYYEWLLKAYWNKPTPDSVQQQFINFRSYLTTNSSTHFFRNLKDYYTIKNFSKIDAARKNLFADTAGMTTATKLLMDSIAYWEANKAKDIKSENLRYLHKRRNQLFKTELEQIEFDQMLAALNQYSNGPRRSILILSLMERWKDQYESRYPVLAYVAEANWTKRYINYRLQEARKAQQEIDTLFNEAAVPGNEVNYIGRPIAQLSSGANLYRLDSIRSATELLVNLRQRFAGKALILDLWATWCVPCMEDMPYSKKLHEENSDLPVEYIYLCSTINSEEATWKSRLGKLKVPGTHIFIDDAILDQLRIKLNASSGFPSHIVIDREGKINPGAISRFKDLDRIKLKEVTGIK